MAFETPVAVPNFLAAVPPQVDTSWLAKLPNDYFQGQQQQRQLAVQNAFSNGLPLDANGQPDYSAAADRLIRLGAVDQGMGFLNAGLQRQGILAAQQAGAELANGGAGSGAAGGSAQYRGNVSTQGANPEVVGYIRQKASALGIDPNTAVAVAAGEGLKGFDPNGSANPGDNGSSFGPYQLHYGNVAGGGNAGAGLGDDFTKATGLNARDPSTWKAQVDFALAHAAKSGWSAFHAAANNGIGAFAGIGGQPAQQPYQVASNGPAAAPARAPVAQPDGSPAVTANTATTRPVTPVQIGAALKLDPQKVADALGIDTTEAVDFNDTGVRQTLRAAFPEQTGGTRPAPASTVGATPAGSAPTSDQPSRVHPFGPGATNAESGNRVASAGPSAGPSTPMPLQQPAGVPAATGVGDPSFGGMVPSQYQANPGAYVSLLRGRAVQLAALPGGDKAAAGFNKMADGIENAIARSDITTPEMKNYQQAVRQGYQGSMMDFANDQAAQRAAAETNARVQAENSPTAIRGAGQKAEATAAGTAQGQAPYDLVATQPAPGGPTVMVPKSDILSGTANGTSQQPAVFADKQKALAQQESAMVDARQQRAVAQERLDAMSKLLEGFQTGAGADQKAALVANARSLGINIPDSATANPAAVEQFAKNATANIFSQAKSLGGKILVSELAGLQKSNANANMQPGANAAIIAQQKGILDWQDAHDDAYSAWKQQNPYAYDSSKFEEDWMKANPVSRFVADAKKNIAPLGMPLPPKNQLVDGQAYMVKGQKARWSASADGFVPVKTP